MSEQRLWNFVRLGIQHAGHLDRIESHAMSQGFPDVNYCLRGVEGNFELKFCGGRKDGFELRANQSRWLSRRVEAGGNCWIIVEYDVDPDHWFGVIPGIAFRELKLTGLPEVWNAKCIKQWWPSRGDEVDFDVLLDILTKRYDNGNSQAA